MSLDSEPVFLDAGVFIGALHRADPRFQEAYPIVDAAHRGVLTACTSVGVLSEVYAALTWVGAEPPLSPLDASNGVVRLVEPPSAIQVLPDGVDVAMRHLNIAGALGLTARRIHDARHAATALEHSVMTVYTYDPEDWQDFAQYGISVAGPPSTLARMGP